MYYWFFKHSNLKHLNRLNIFRKTFSRQSTDVWLWWSTLNWLWRGSYHCHQYLHFLDIPSDTIPHSSHLPSWYLVDPIPHSKSDQNSHLVRDYYWFHCSSLTVSSPTLPSSSPAWTICRTWWWTSRRSRPKRWNWNQDRLQSILQPAPGTQPMIMIQPWCTQ